ncbi:TonB-dependent receptor [Sphingomonas sp. AP4-R1]|uniref:TonB-dependent receptor n=1 Tax=Sphingomonas sp. AP4-R1 TaxID=2735134 RepID=UPI0014933C80|nr:TonB-dependent receptor [Sphingomonas sp. AP4-R1]QJU60084.1 TonB-dependent receptor [Sphingomonas sp. AP4-R1]
MTMGKRVGRTIGCSGLGSVLLAGAPAMVAHAQSTQAGHVFAIAGGPLQQALTAYAATTGIQLLYASELVEGRTAPRLVGRYTDTDALSRLLAGSGIGSRRVDEKVVVLEVDARPAPAPGTPQRTDDKGALAEAEPAHSTPVPAPPRTSDASDARRDTIEPIVVTGSHIRGVSAGTPPVIRFDRDDFDRRGYATVGQALQALPGNFGGMATEQSAQTLADRTGSNATLATGVNLRGLGAGATLVLVNGQRLGGSGTEGAFADVSTIPTGALDRVEILEDGASAIYGSDAVGGVVNILLRRRFTGEESRLRLGTVTKGGRRDVQAGQTLGRRWSGGGAMLAYEFGRTGRLANLDRPFTRSEDLRSLGGTDHSSIVSAPGNILGIDPRTGALGVTYGIRPGSNGGAPQFAAGSANREDRLAYGDLIPRQTRHSAYAAIDQEIADGITLTADVRYSHRAFEAHLPPALAVVTITRANPYFVSPTGAASDMIAYSMGPEAGAIRNHGFSEALAGSVGLDAELGRDWKLRGYGAFAQSREHYRSDNQVNTAALAEATGSVADDPTTPYSTPRDGYFNPYGAGSSNRATTIAYITSGFSDIRVRTRVLSAHVDADGALIALPAGDAKLAVGGDIRRESFATLGTAPSGGAGVRTLYDIGGHRLVTAGFAELAVPLFGAANARPGVERLDLSVSGRVEQYQAIGTTANPKVGLSWVPLSGLTVRSNWGTSFRAPNLRQLRAGQVYSVSTLRSLTGATVPVIQLTGGNPDLKPEKARSWTAGVDIVPAPVPGLSLHATWFHTIFRQRIATPANDNFSNALRDPTLAPFVETVSPVTNPADLARINALYADPAFRASSSGFPPTSIGAIVDTRNSNTGRVTVSGLDLTVGYALPVGANRFDLSMTGTYLDRWDEKVTPTSASVDRLDQIGRPLSVRGQGSLGWTRGRVNALATLHHVTGYRDPTGRRIHAWDTVDLQVGVRIPARAGWLGGTSIAIAASNLFDTAPPFYDNPNGYGYDATNADALGRYVSLQLTRTW